MNKSIIFTVVGPGVMAEAIIAGMLRKGVALPDHILIAGPEADRNEELKSCYGITPYSDNAEAVLNADVVILSVKPQLLDHVMKGLKGKLQPEALVLSIVAGASIDKLCSGLDHSSVIRAMPNTPAQIGEGITVWTGSGSVLPEQLELGRQILCSLGTEIYVDEEPYLDMATALSGSGPSYVFLFMEAMIDAGVHLGFSRRIAEQLVVETLRGSVDYYDHKKSHVARLRNEVTSPGGTSAEALYYLEKAGFRTAISRAIWAAYERSQELGKGKHGSDPEAKA